MSSPKPASPSSAAPAAVEQREGAFYSGATLSRADSIGWLMKQAIAGLTRELQERMTTLDVTPAQWPVLLIMSQAGAQDRAASGQTGPGKVAPDPSVPCEPTAIDLARQLSMDAGAMTRMLDRMSEKGLVERHRCPLDRRATRLALTDSGRETVRPIADVLAATLNQMLRGFSREEFELLLALLKRLNANCQSFPSGAAGTADADPSSGGASSPATSTRPRTGPPNASDPSPAPPPPTRTPSAKPPRRPRSNAGPGTSRSRTASKRRTAI